MKFTTIVVLAGIVATAVPSCAQAPSAKPPAPAVNASAAVLAAFTQRVNAYAALRKGAEKGEAKLKTTEDPAKLQAATEALAAKVRAARPAAKLADIFTIESRPVFKRLLSPQLKGAEGAENKAAIKDDNPGAMTLKVNQPYPKGEPLSTVPPDILKALPVLPGDLEYRFVGKHMILYDARAGLIVDYIPNAIP